MEDSDEDIEGRDSSHPPRTAVLWEKCIQQSIFVDLSEDESLHFSDLESSFLVHLSQAESASSEASLHLSGSAELSALEDSSSSECSGASSKDDENLMKARSNHSLKQGTPPRPTNTQGKPPCTQDNEDLGPNTSDEDQDDLPYDASPCNPSERQSEDQRPSTMEPGVEMDNALLARARSLSELKYGQGQVHYRLPDFSKVAPKVKIPKAPSGPPTPSGSRPAVQPPSTMHRAQSSPGILGLISRVLEDSVQPQERPYVFPDQEEHAAPVMVHHLQAEYDKLLTKYAEAENLIDEMRLGNKGLPGSHFESPAPPSPPAENQPSEPTDGERMTTELRDIIREFMEKVEEFKVNLNKTSISLADQQMMLRSMMEAQDQLQRQYIDKKEAHRALEMQNYIGLCRNTGTFDPDRLVEGDIFRVGMQLEDVKEIIDRNVCDQLSPPHRTSTPTSVPPMPPPLGVSAAYELWRAAEDEEEEVGADSELEQSRESSPTHSSEHSGPAPQFPHTDPHGLEDSLEGLDIAATVDNEDDEEEQRVEKICSFSEGKLCDGVLAHRIVSPETDSGFGSSDLLQPGGGTYQSKLLTESATAVVRPPSDGLSASDSEYSSSNLQTAIHPPTPTHQPTKRRRRRSSLPTASQSESPMTGLQSVSCQTRVPTTTPGCGATSAVEMWVESTTKDLHPSRTKRAQHHLSDPTLGTAMHAPQRGGQLHSCSCNSEALVALQTEVSRLKAELEDGLVQLPHLSQKMDNLASKYRLDRQDRRSKTRPRSQPRKSCNSVWKPLGSRSGVWEDGSNPASTTDSGKPDDSMVMLRFHTGEDVRRVRSKEKPRLLSPPPLQKPLLQINYTSSCSLPASYKVREPTQPASNHRKRSVQSDSALLPSNVFFRRTPSPALECLRKGSGRRGSKEEEMNQTLDLAIEAARCMKRTTDRMAKSLSADLAKAQLHRKLQHAQQPPGGRRGAAP
ncbi:hypothetical protein NHX12_003826 [Muraenolepis orangiensis]|uniref:AKNA domain-containing protein n=1 Tax=Muraenolepis orangiensis TaxID=630683 RepID=A0A9Q0ID98_9TELE|nr:hypothetical protein NHX12_003826 [Muraenolepis orangiensis]